MPKKKDNKRSISSLIENRATKRFGGSGFDLLAEGEKIIRKTEPTLSVDSEAKEIASEADFAVKESAVDLDAKVDSAIEYSANESVKVVECGDVFDSGADNAIAGSAVGDNALEGILMGLDKRSKAETFAKKISQDYGDDTFPGALAAYLLGSDSIRKSLEVALLVALKKRAEFDMDKYTVERCAIEYFAGEMFAKEVKGSDGFVGGIDVSSGAKENPAIVDDATALNSVVGVADDVGSGDGFAGADFAYAEDATHRVAVADYATKVYAKAKRGEVLATKYAHRKAKGELEKLREDRNVKVQVDGYIIDSLFAKLNNPSLSILYLYLWRRTKGEGKDSVALSINVMSDATGMSTRTVQTLIKKLNEMNLIKSLRSSATSMTEHVVIEPWK